MRQFALGICISCLLLFAVADPVLPVNPGPVTHASEPDTLIRLEPVSVVARRFQLTRAGFNRYHADTMVLARHSFSGLDRLLTEHAGIHVKMYGPGLLSTLSMRGGSASHTALLWNGLPLESPMTGQQDIALLPVYLFDHIGVQYGGSSANWGSGALGGVVFLESGKNLQPGISIEAGFQGESIGNASQLAGISYAGDRARGSIRAFRQRAENRYEFIHPAMAPETRQRQKHAGYEGQGMLAETVLRVGSRSELGVHLWLQDFERKIPPTLFQQHNGALQEDHAVRLSAGWQTVLDRMLVNWRGGWFNEGLMYTDSLGVDSRSRWRTFVQEADAGMQIMPGLTVNAGLRFQYVAAETDFYSGTADRSLLAGFYTISWESADGRLLIRTDGRQEVGGSYRIPFVPAAGLAWRFHRGWHVKANAGKNFRLPSLNDLYWSPGGNPDLKPEEGWSKDAGIGWEGSPEYPRLIPGLIRSFSVTAYHRLIRDWIIWLPAGGGMIWRPENIMLVRSHGMEARISGQLELGGADIGWHAGWDYTISRNLRGKSPNDASVGKQLMYVPRHTGLLGLRFSRGAWDLTYDHRYTGRSFTSSDNLDWIPAWNQADLRLNRTLAYRLHQLHIFVQVINLWDQHYHIMPGRPMPLRYFQGGARLRLNPSP